MPNSIKDNRSDAEPGIEMHDLGYLISVLWREKLRILIVTLIAMLIGVGYAVKLAKPIYQTSATVMLNSRDAQVLDFDSVLGGLGSDISALNTEVEVLRSGSLLTKVVNQLNLTEDPEFNPDLPGGQLYTEGKKRFSSNVRYYRRSSLGRAESI